MAGKYENTNLINQIFNVPQQEYLELQVRDYSQVKLDEKKAEIETRPQIVSQNVGSGSGSSIWLYAGIGLVVVGLAAVVILKKKGIIKF